MRDEWRDGGGGGTGDGGGSGGDGGDGSGDGGGNGGGNGPGGPGGSGGSGTGGPSVDITGAPDDGIPWNPVGNNPRCVATDFRLRIKARDESGIRSVEVFLDGDRIKRTTSRKLFVWIPAEELRAARHSIRVVATGNNGDRTVTRRSFRRCGAPAFPSFTG